MNVNPAGSHPRLRCCCRVVMAVVAYVFVEVIGIDGDLRVGEDLRRIAVTQVPDSCLIFEAWGGEGGTLPVPTGKASHGWEVRATCVDVETIPIVHRGVEKICKRKGCAAEEK
jgi:hypothetical protein